MFIVHIGESVHEQAYATEAEALAYIASKSGYLGTDEHKLEPTTFGKAHHYLNPRTGRWNKGSYRVTEVNTPLATWSPS